MRTANECMYEARLGHGGASSVTAYAGPASASVDTAPAVDFSPLDPHLVDDFWPRMATLRKKRRVNMCIAVVADLPGRTARTMSAVSGLHGGIALHADRARAVWLNRKA